MHVNFIEMLSVVWLLIFLFALTTCTIDCPNSEALYKEIDEQPWTFSIKIDSNTESVTAFIRRTTNYECSNNNNVTFNTNRVVLYKAWEWIHDRYEFQRTDLGSCVEDCVGRVVNVSVGYLRRSSQSSWSTIGAFNYFVKNCDKLHWTNWIATSNCDESRSNVSFARFCVDCDRVVVDQIYCSGITTKQEPCYFWSDWGQQGPCTVTSKCNLNGERNRIRECLFRNGSKASDDTMCSNQSAIMREQCNITNVASDCLQNLSNMSTDTGLHICVGITVPLILILCIIIVFDKYRRCSTNKFLSKVEKQSTSLQGLADVAEEAKSGSINSDSNQATNPNAYDFAENLKTSNVCEFAETKAPIYCNETISNSYKTQQPLEDSEPSYCTIQKSDDSLGKQNDAYSSLSNLDEPGHNDYSTLGDR